MRPCPNRLLDLREYPVLYVDDERENLRSFELTFRREFKIFTARDAQEGLALLNQHPVALVLSDHKMPGMTGVEFLARVKEVDARALRMLVTAYGDAQTLQDAINNGAIYRFIAKPWNPDEMRVTLRRAIETYALERERAQLLQEFTHLHRAAKAIAGELDEERLGELLLDLITGDFGYDAAALLAADAAGARLRVRRLSRDFGEVGAALRELEISREQAGEFIAALAEGRAQLLRSDEALDQRPILRRWVSEVAAGEILVLPLCGQTGLLGALAIDNRRGGRGFSADDRSLLEGLAQQAVVGIENARLFAALRRARNRIDRADRLAVLGALAARSADQIEAPLERARRWISEAPGLGEGAHAESRRVARAALDAVSARLAEMRRLMERGGPAPRALCDLAEIAEDALSAQRVRAQEAGVRLSLAVPQEPAKLVGDRAQLEQLVSNLVANAVEASSRGGVVDVRVGAEPGRPGVSLEVIDQGRGIPSEVLEGLFDPFPSDSAGGRGAGLGLVICAQVARDHGGEIQVESRPGQTLFRVQLATDSDPAAR
jgi:two-component system NtrC family sensor kinase